MSHLDKNTRKMCAVLQRILAAGGFAVLGKVGVPPPVAYPLLDSGTRRKRGKTITGDNSIDQVYFFCGRYYA